MRDQRRKAVRTHRRSSAREALELALYTFRYIDKAELVVATFIPPKDLSDVMYFTKSDLENQLQTPLRATLPRPNADSPEPLGEASNIADASTATAIFAHRFVHERHQGANALMLAPPAGEGCHE